eukprot:2398672-Alexandrium_andersonii.AAC.1
MCIRDRVPRARPGQQPANVRDTSGVSSCSLHKLPREGRVLPPLTAVPPPRHAAPQLVVAVGVRAA